MTVAFSATDFFNTDFFCCWQLSQDGINKMLSLVWRSFADLFIP